MSVLKNFLGPLWLLYVFSWYIHYHDYYWSSFSFWATAFFLVVLWAIPFLAIWGWNHWKKKTTLKLTPLRVVLTVVILIWITGIGLYAMMDPAVMTEPYQFVQYDDSNFAMFEEGERLVEGVVPSMKRGTILLHWEAAKMIFPEPIQAFFSKKTVIGFAGGLALNMSILFGSWFFLIVLFHNLGAVILKPKKFTPIYFFQSVAMGVGMVMFTLFALGAMAILTTTATWIAMSLLLIVGLVRLPFLIKGIKNAQATIQLNASKWWLVPVLNALGILLAFSVLRILKPFPIGYDSMTLYHNTTNLLVHYESLVSGIAAYNYGLIISLGPLLWKSTMVGTGISVLGALLGLGVLFELLRQYFSWEKAALLITVFISLPMNQFLMSMDLKIDLPLLLFTLLGIYSMMQWKQSKSSKDLVLAGIWLGIGLGIKYTTALLILVIGAWLVAASWGALGAMAVGAIGLGLFGWIGYDFYLNSFAETTQNLINNGWMGLGFLLGGWACITKGWPKKSWKPLLVIGLVSIAMLSPWLIYNGVQAHSLNPSGLLFGERYTIPFSTEEFKGTTAACETVSNYDELEIYTGDYQTHSLALVPIILWESTIASGMPNDRLTDISFLFLGFAFFVIFALKEMGKKDKHLRKIVGYSLLYGMLWLFTSRGIVWYGMPLFLPLLIIYGRAWDTEKWAHGVVGVWLLMSVLLGGYSMRTEIEPLLYAGGATDDSIYIEQVSPGAEAMAAILNNEAALDKNIYLIGRFIEYFITENDRRIYDDLLLDNFRCYFMNDNPQVTLARLRAANFGYVLYSEDALLVEEEGSPLHDEFEKAKAFMDDYLVEEVYTPDMVLYSVPS